MNNSIINHTVTTNIVGNISPQVVANSKPINLYSHNIPLSYVKPITSGRVRLTNRLTSSKLKLHQLALPYVFMDLTPPLPTVPIDEFLLLPDKKNKKLYYVLSQPQLLNFSLNVYKEEIDGTIKITSGKILLEVEAFAPENQQFIERLLITEKNLQEYRNYKVLPLNISMLSGEFLNYSEQEVTEVTVSTNRESASAIVEITLTDIGALAWQEAIRLKKVTNLQGRFLLTLKTITRNGNRTGNQTIQIGKNIGLLMRKVTMEQVTIIHPAISFNTNIIVHRSSFIDNITIDFHPSEGHQPQSATCGSEGGSFAYKITTDNVDKLKINLVYRIIYTNPRWPPVIVRKTLNGSDTDFSDIISPEAWLEQFTVSVFQTKKNIVQEEIGEELMENRVICQFIYSAPELGLIPINETIEPLVGTVNTIFFPRPPETIERTIQMTIFPMANPDGIKFLQYTDSGLNSIIISAAPGGQLTVSDNLSPLPEQNWENNLIRLLSQQQNMNIAKRPPLNESQVTGGYPMTVESTDTPEFQRLLRYLGITETEFLEHEPYYFYEMEYALNQHGIWDSEYYLDRYNYHNAVAEFQSRNRLNVDGLPGANTLWAMQFPLVQSGSYNIRKVDADRVTGYLEGYNSFRLREDAADYYEGLLNEMHSYGGVITSSGSLRSLSANVSAGRSSKSMHYTGIAFDLYIQSGMKNPKIDPFIVTQDGSKFRVYCRASRGEDKVLEAIKWRGGRITTETTEARVIDFTEMAANYGFKNIGPRSCFPKNYLCAEWWHFQNEWVVTPFFSQFGIEVLKLNSISLSQLHRSSLWQNRKKIFQRGWF